ncbi:MAG: phosphate acyltransferase PlsX [Holophagaceae bacterium]|nr:phosphate acyltransferase PlsX [Holophagaceae bacterium]
MAVSVHNSPATCRIALDVMGGDHGPKVILLGAALALRAMPELFLLFVGNKSEIETHIEHSGLNGELLARTEIVPSASVVDMDDKATCVLKEKKDSSARQAAECVRGGEAVGWVTMGHTGAAMVASMKVIGRLRGVARPCLATVFPNLQKGTPTVILDVGANVDCKPEHIAQFALMGGVYAEEVLGVHRPKIGVLSVGEEDAKGSGLTRNAAASLRAMNINFGGNAEGRDIWKGDFDVIACDGFVGNVVLKSSEALAEAIRHGLKESIESNMLSRMGGLLVRPSMRRFYKSLDYTEYGGAPLLGVKGISIIGHGRSNDRAVANAIRAAVLGATHNINDRIQARMRHLVEVAHET